MRYIAAFSQLVSEQSELNNKQFDASRMKYQHLLFARKQSYSLSEIEMLLMDSNLMSIIERDCENLIVKFYDSNIDSHRSNWVMKSLLC